MVIIQWYMYIYTYKRLKITTLMQSHFFIQTATLIAKNSLQISFNDGWYQDHIIELSKLLFDKLEYCQLTERVCGADKEYYRFVRLKHSFVVHFECYGQSCWIENEVESSSNDNLLVMLEERLSSK